jgi:uncharacterized protein (TIGR02147 family)
MKDLYDYRDYGEFLRDAYDTRRAEKRSFSMRYISLKAHMDVSYVSKILTGDRHLPVGKIPAFAAVFGLTGRRAVYFEALVLAGRAHSPEEKHPFEEAMNRLRTSPAEPLSSEQQSRLYSRPHHPGVRAMLGLSDWIDEYDILGRRMDPPLRAAEIHTALLQLQEDGLVERDQHEILRPSEAHVRTAAPLDRAAIRNYHKAMLELGKRSLSVHPPERRDMSTLTITASAESLPDIRALIADCREEIRKRIALDNDPDTVYQLNFQVFPLTRESK